MSEMLLFDAMRTDPRIIGLSTKAHYFYLKLLAKVDDTCRYHAHPALLRAGLYPFAMDDVSEADMVAYLDTCVAAGLVKTYWVDNEKYLELTAFQEEVFAARHPSEFPAPETGTLLTSLKDA